MLPLLPGLVKNRIHAAKKRQLSIVDAYRSNIRQTFVSHLYCIHRNYMISSMLVAVSLADSNYRVLFQRPIELASRARTARTEPVRSTGTEGGEARPELVPKLQATHY